MKGQICSLLLLDAPGPRVASAPNRARRVYSQPVGALLKLITSQRVTQRFLHFVIFYTISRSPNARIEMAAFSSLTVAFSFNHCFQNTNFIKFSFFTSFKIKSCRCAVFILKMLYITMLELYPNN